MSYSVCVHSLWLAGMTSIFGGGTHHNCPHPRAVKCPTLILKPTRFNLVQALCAFASRYCVASATSTKLLHYMYYAHVYGLLSLLIVTFSHIIVRQIYSISVSTKLSRDIERCFQVILQAVFILMSSTYWLSIYAPVNWVQYRKKLLNT